VTWRSLRDEDSLKLLELAAITMGAELKLAALHHIKGHDYRG